MKLKKIGLSALALVAATTAFGQRDGTRDNYLGVEVGAYFPTDAKIRDIFGTSVLKVGFNYGNVGRQADKWRLTYNFNFISAEKDGNRFFLLPVTAAVGRVFGEEGASTRTYVRAGIGLAYMDYGIDVTSVDRRSGRKILPTANAELGVILSDRLRLAGSYSWFSKTDGFDFSGFQLTLSYNLVRF
jgi:hypothetical protein